VLAPTAKSLVVVCQAGPGNFYYRGVRLSDGARIELDGAVRSSGSLTSPTRPTEPAIRRPGGFGIDGPVPRPAKAAPLVVVTLALCPAGLNEGSATVSPP
jgi:hypothetical protein